MQRTGSRIKIIENKLNSNMHMNNSWGARQKELAEAGFRKPTRDEAALINEARNKVNQMKGRSDKNDPMAHLPQMGADAQ